MEEMIDSDALVMLTGGTLKKKSRYLSSPIAQFRSPALAKMQMAFLLFHRARCMPACRKRNIRTAPR